MLFSTRTTGRLSPLLLAVLLSACGGTTTTTIIDNSGPSVAALKAHDALSSRVTALSNTPAADVPVSETVDFAGSATLLLFTAPSTTALIGDAALTADFGNKTIEGTIDDFVGTDRFKDEKSYDGEILIENGQIGTNGSFVADFRGGVARLGQLMNDVIVNGSLTGRFKDTPVSALTASGSTSVAIVNGAGTTSAGLLVIVAERQ